MGEQNVFQFRYTALTVKATVSGDSLSIKQGIRTFVVPISAIKGIYIENHPNAMRELVLAYEKTPGKNKIVRTYTDAAQPDFDRLVETLVDEKPEADLRALSSKEAYAKLGAVNMNRAAMLAVPPIIIVVMAVFVSPFLIHGLDNGLERVSVEMLAGGHKPASRNLELVGALDADHGIVETITRKGTTTTHNYFPVVPFNAQPNMPIAVVLETDDVSDDELGRMAADGAYRCVLRDVLWEGLASDNIDFFKKQYGRAVADDVRLCELGINTSMSLIIFLIAMGTTALVMIVVVIVLARQQRRSR